MADKAEKIEVPETFDDTDYEAAFNSAAEIEGESEVVEEPTTDSDAGTAKPDDSEGAVKEPEPTSEPETSPEVKRLEEQLTKMETLLAEAARRTEPKAPEKPAEPAKPAKEVEEEEAALKEVAEDWPTIHKAMEIRIKQLEAKLAETLNGFEKKVATSFAPIQASVQETSQERFLNAINAKHPDASTLLPKVEKWIETQPPFLQKAYNEALDNGTAADVIALYDTFKTATSPAAPAVEKAEKERRLERMEGVKTERSAATPLADDDFEGAFERAASQK